MHLHTTKVKQTSTRLLQPSKKLFKHPSVQRKKSIPRKSNSLLAPSRRSFFKSIIHKLTAPVPPKSAFDLPPIDVTETTKPQHVDFQFTNHSPSPFLSSQLTHTPNNLHTFAPNNTQPVDQYVNGHDRNPSIKIAPSSKNAAIPPTTATQSTIPSNQLQHTSQISTPSSKIAANPTAYSSHRKFRKFSPIESELTMLLCSVTHPETKQDLIQSEFITQIKETSPGNVLIRIKLDKHFRDLKTSIESLIRSKFTIESDKDYNSMANVNSNGFPPRKHLHSLKISLSDSQDDLTSLDPVRNVPQTTSLPPSPPSSSSSSSSKLQSAAKLSTTSMKSTPTTTSSLKAVSEFQSNKQLSTSAQQQGIGAGQRGLAKVKRVIFVYSAKGGVGKSSIAANLAVALSETPYVPSEDENFSDHIEDSNMHSTNRNLRIGVFDADIYGPSLPTIIDTVSLSRGVLQGDGLDITSENTSSTIDLVEDFQDDTSALIRPIQAHNIKMMSYGYVTRTKGGHGSGQTGPAPAIMRGGMVAPYLTELLTRTNWGDLDVLVIDMPPGTSDIHITLTQQVRNASAVIVTTPNKLAFVDVVRGLQLLDQTNIPVISLVQNMSYFIAPHDKLAQKHYIFGKGENFQKQIRTLGSIPTAIEMPIVPTIAENADIGLPLTMQYMNDLRSYIPTTTPRIASTFSNNSSSQTLQNDSANTLTTHSHHNNEQIMIQNTLQNFAQLAKDVYHWSSPSIRSTISRPEMSLEYLSSPVRKILIKTSKEKPGITNPAAQFNLDPFEVRASCICAACKHEFTGTQLSDRNKIDQNVHPVAVQSRGAYAVAIQWSDGHAGSIYTWEQLKSLPRV